MPTNGVNVALVHTPDRIDVDCDASVHAEMDVMTGIATAEPEKQPEITPDKTAPLSHFPMFADPIDLFIYLAIPKSSAEAILALVPHFSL
jgi:hypothetical protein